MDRVPWSPLFRPFCDLGYVLDTHSGTAFAPDGTNIGREPEEVDMVSAWWLLVAFWLGGCAGVVLAAVLAASRRQEDARERAEHDTHLRGDGKLAR